MSSNIKIGAGGLSFFLLMAVLGYFVYGGTGGFVAMFILTFAYTLSCLLALIPFIGVFAQGLIMFYLVNPWFFGFTGITATWLTWFAFVVYVIVGILVTIITSAWALKKL